MPSEAVIKMQKAVVEWIQPLLPDDKRDAVNTSIKLSEEASELTHALYAGGKDVGEELADILILALDIAYLKGIDIEAEFWRKMTKNHVRRWNEQKGALKHEN